MRGRRPQPLQDTRGRRCPILFTRREAIGSAALGAGAATLGGMQAIAQTVPRKTFVLIHGAYHGGWCWRKVVDILEKQGHKVYAPSLTGLADRSHLLSMNLTLDTHITDIVNLFKWEDINNGCLAVHSGGGWPGSGALEQIGDRVSSIVWVDAFIPKNGESQLDQISPFQPQGVGRSHDQGRGRPQAADGEPVRVQREGLRLDGLQAHAATELDRPRPQYKSTPEPCKRWRRRPSSAHQNIRRKCSTGPTKSAKRIRHGRRM